MMWRRYRLIYYALFEWKARTQLVAADFTALVVLTLLGATNVASVAVFVDLLLGTTATVRCIELRWPWAVVLAVITVINTFGLSRRRETIKREFDEATDAERGRWRMLAWAYGIGTFVLFVAALVGLFQRAPTLNVR
jgi:hypothetical protein